MLTPAQMEWREWTNTVRERRRRAMQQPTTLARWEAVKQKSLARGDPTSLAETLAEWSICPMTAQDWATADLVGPRKPAYRSMSLVHLMSMFKKLDYQFWRAFCADGSSCITDYNTRLVPFGIAVEMTDFEKQIVRLVFRDDWHAAEFALLYL